MRNFSKAVILGLGLCLSYAFLGHLGLSMHAVNKYATFIWAPSGLAIGALFIVGEGFWPAIFLAAYWVNFTTGGTVVSALCIASGNTLEAVLTVYLLRRAEFLNFYSFSDVLKFMLVGVPWGTAFSASVGTGSLYLLKMMPASQVFQTWGTWWLGDMGGVLVVAPLLIVWCQPPWARPTAKKVLEAFALVASVAFLGCFMYLNLFDVKSNPFIRPRLYFLFPLITWAAVRFGPRGGSTVVALYSVIATGTILKDPTFFPSFASDVYFLGLFQLATFLMVAAMMQLILSAVFEERRRAIQTRDDFFNIASHELKTPLTSLKLQTQIALHKLKKAGDKGFSKESIADLLNLNDIQINKINRLINEMFDVAKVDSGTLQLSIHEMDFSETLKEVIARMNPQISNAGCELVLDIEKEITGKWDRVRVEQIFENLIGNACKYGAGKPIEISAFSKPDCVKMSVKDYGLGIEKKEQARIFNRFERGSSSKHAGNQIGGLGLGLYIVTQIAKKHNGAVKVESDPGKGATFTLELPRQDLT